MQNTLNFMRRITLVAVALSCFGVSGANATFENGNSLYDHCQQPPNSAFEAVCSAITLKGDI